MRIIIHLDMDHFFTAVEEREHPELKGKPVVVGADPKNGLGRGVVSTANYVARKFSVRSGIPISKAWKLCPEAVYLPVNYVLYSRVSDLIMKILRSYGDKFEQWGIDEAFLDVTSKVKDYAEAEELGRRIKKAIFDEQHLTCSIGIGPNKLVAKMASEFQKPDGLTVVREDSAELFLAPLPVRKLLWVGRKTEQRLQKMGIKTIGDLARFNPDVLAETFGAIGSQLYMMAHGVDNSEVRERGEVKSIGREITFQQDTDDFEEVRKVVRDLSKDVNEEAVTSRLFFRTVTIKVRYENFETHTHAKSLPSMSNRQYDVERIAAELIQPYLRSERKIRLVGVRISNLVSRTQQKTLL